MNSRNKSLVPRSVKSKSKVQACRYGVYCKTTLENRNRRLPTTDRMRLTPPVIEALARFMSERSLRLEVGATTPAAPDKGSCSNHILIISSIQSSISTMARVKHRLCTSNSFPVSTIESLTFKYDSINNDFLAGKNPHRSL